MPFSTCVASFHIKTVLNSVVKCLTSIYFLECTRPEEFSNSKSVLIIMILISERLDDKFHGHKKQPFCKAISLRETFSYSPPHEANAKDKIWLLKKCVYGLNDASLYWYKKVKDILIETGGKISKVDPTVFSWYDKFFFFLLLKYFEWSATFNTLLDIILS